MVPFIDLRPYVELVRSGHWHPTRAPFGEDVAYLLNTCEFISGGPTTRRFEGLLADKLGAQHAVACANGTDALQLALRAAGIERGHRVAMPNLTFWATFEAIVNVGATPVLLDVDETYLHMDFEEFTRAFHAHRFNAAVLVHLYGWCSPKLDEFRSFCRDKRITLIEDGAQAFGVKFAGHSIFEDAAVATLSFHPAKVIGSIGDGGAVLTRSARTASRVRALANHGRVAHHEHAVAGWNSRMDAIQAAWLLRALEVSNRVIEERRRLAQRYANRVYPVAASVVPSFDCYDNGYMQVVTVDSEARPRIVKRLAELGVEARTVYPLTIADQPGAKQYGIPIGELSVSRRFVEQVINLPLWYGMKDEDVERCAAAFSEAIR